MNEVNKQLIVAAKDILALHDNEVFVANPWNDSMEDLRQAIAAAEQVQQAEPVLVVELEPDYWYRGHFCEGSKPYIDQAKVRSLQIGTKLYTHPPAVAVPDDLLRKVGSIVDGLRTKANNNPHGVKASTLESFANELCEVFEMLAAAEQVQPIPITKEDAKTHIEKLLWSAIDTMAVFPSEKPDGRVWEHVKAYMPEHCVFQKDWRTHSPNVSSEHIEVIAKACKLIPSHTTQDLVDRVIGFGHVLLGDKAVQEKFVEANAHLLRTDKQPAAQKENV